MKKTAALAAVVAVPALLFSAGPVQAATVSFDDIAVAPGVPDLFVGATPSGNGLTINLSKFVASAESANSTSVKTDTIAFTINALPNYVITKITLTEGFSWSAANGFVLLTGSMTVDGAPSVYTQTVAAESGGKSFDLFVPAGASWTIADNITSVPVSITNTLIAVAYASATAPVNIEKTSALVTVETAFIPLPPSVWLLGSALFGVGVLGRRMRGVKAA